MSIRKLTKEQFSDGTTIDGNRVDRALVDAVGRLNELEASDIKRRWLQSHFVWGYQPNNGQTYPHPFLRIDNVASQVTGNIPSEGIQNERRLKGTFHPYVAGYEAPLHWAWTNSIYFERPAIIRTVHASFHTPIAWPANFGTIEWPNNWNWDGGGGKRLPPGVSHGDSVEDACLELSVDNPFSVEDRSQTAIEFHRTRFYMTSQLIAPLGFATTPALDGEPAFTSTGGNTLYPGGVFCISDNVNLPVPGKSRVRVSIVIPDWDRRAGSGNYGSPWGTSQAGAPAGVKDPWQTQFYSAGMTVLEATEE